MIRTNVLYLLKLFVAYTTTLKYVYIIKSLIFVENKKRWKNYLASFPFTKWNVVLSFEIEIQDSKSNTNSPSHLLSMSYISSGIRATYFCWKFYNHK